MLNQKRAAVSCFWRRTLPASLATLARGLPSRWCARPAALSAAPRSRTELLEDSCGLEVASVRSPLSGVF